MPFRLEINQHLPFLFGINASNFEANRLATFGRYMMHFLTCLIPTLEFAKKGFFATGNRDEVECYRCGVRHSQWQPNQRDLRAVHRQASQDCPFARDEEDYYSGQFAPNIPIPGGDTFNVNRGIADTGREAEISLRHQPLAVSFGIHLRNLSEGRRVTQHTAQYPQFSWDDRRRNTFHGFPAVRDRDRLVRELVKHGFFFVGQGDIVICFSCGLGLHRWQPEDDPRLVHMHWSPDCWHMQTVERATVRERADREMGLIGAAGRNA